MSRRVLLAIAGLAVLVRLPFVCHIVHQPGFNWTWGGEMAQIASSLVQGRGFGSPYGGMTGPTAIEPPFYPAYLALLLRVMGDPMRAMYAQIAVNVFASVAIIFPIYLAGERLQRGAGTIAAVLWALAPVLTGYTDVQPWSTSMFTLLMASLVALVVCRPDRVVAIGLLAGGAAWVDPAHLPATATVVLAATAWRRLSVVSAAKLAGMILLVSLPWLARNAVVFGHITYLRSNGPYDLYRGMSTSPYDWRAINLTNPGRNPHELAVYTSLGEDAYMRAKATQLRQLLVSQPRTMAIRATQHVWLFWTGTSELGGTLRRMMFLWPVPFAVAGLVVLIRRNAFVGWMTALAIGIYSAPYSFSLSMPRYRSPIEPMLWLLVALATSRLVRLQRT